MKLYLLVGKARSGKNSFANILKKEWEMRGRKVCILKLTAPLYYYSYQYFGWDGKEETKDRTFLQKFGTEYIKNELQMDHFLLNRLLEDIHILNPFFDIGIITDGRLQEEVIELKKKFKDLEVIFVERPDFDNHLTKEEKAHITEQDLDSIVGIDEKIYNTSLEKLQKQAQKLVEEEEKRL